MPMTLYRSIIRQSFIIAWKHKYLWFFGLFATLLSSNFEIELINRFTNRSSSTIYDWQRWAQTGIFSPSAWANLGQMMKTDPWSFASIIIVIIVIVALALALLWLAVVSQGALVSNANKAVSSGGKVPSSIEKKHDTAMGFREGRKNFWPIFGVNALVRIMVYVLALITIAPVAISAHLTVTASLMYFILFIILLAVALILAFITKYAIAYVVLKGQAMGQSIVSAWRLFKKNWLVSLEMTFILFALTIVATLAIILAVLLLAIPIALLYVLSVFVASFPLFLATIVLGLIFSIALVVIGGSILTVIQTTAWVALFNQLVSGKGPDSKLERVFGNIL